MRRLLLIAATLFGLTSQASAYGCSFGGGWPGAMYGLPAQLLTDSLPCYGTTGTIGSAVVLQTTPTITTPNFTTSFSIGGVIFGTRYTAGAIYHAIVNPDGANYALQAGNVTDPVNYYNNTTHKFRNLNGTATFADISSAGILYYGSTSGTHTVTAPAVAGAFTSTWPSTTGVIINSGASNAVTNTMAANMVANSVKCNPTAGSAVPQDCTYQQTTVILGQLRYFVSASAVNFFSGNTDTTITLPTPPTGFTRYSVRGVTIAGPSASLNPSTVGLFTAAAAGGTALVASGTAVTVTATTDSTNNNMQILSPVNVNTMSNLYSALTSGQLFFRVQTASAIAATANVTLEIQWLP